MNTALASESTLSRVDLFIERLPWEIQYTCFCKSQSKQSYLRVKGNMILLARKTCSYKQIDPRKRADSRN